MVPEAARRGKPRHDSVRFLTVASSRPYPQLVGTASNPIDRDTVAARVAGFPRVTADRAELKQAAVAVCVIERDGPPCLLLTRRAAGLRAHAGQWALPGGRLDDGETATEGALRELAGAANKLAVLTQPSPSAVVSIPFLQQPVIGVQDQFGNLRNSTNGTADNSTIVAAARLAVPS